LRSRLRSTRQFFWTKKRRAKEKGLLVIGTLGLLERAAAGNLIDLRASLTALQKTNMRIGRSLIHDALERQNQKRAKPGPPSASGN
jgi:predicted nucleic acid-binding protein